ncbi:protein of unknown function (plasmid) [Cupriavidus neocaledonicus]|uniref:Uncharacterized protein n=1 Tax=Cupriavidus neocaledonicus TaxID=1040979 RepID=A0A375HQL9_9BURK|nr:hypothetical protein CBM2605_B150019 [Cupriavidus neocaledonicus]SPD59087.1 protein of unknown function [Cupriavidus neocaledonicus]
MRPAESDDARFAKALGRFHPDKSAELRRLRRNAVGLGGRPVSR